MVVGLDASWTSFGISDGSVTKIIKVPIMSTREARASMIMGYVLEFARGADLWVLEGPAFGAQAGSLWDMGYLAGRVEQLAQSTGHKLLIVNPLTLKKFITGKGNAPKITIPLAVYKKWGVEFDKDIGADKAHAYALHRYGLAVQSGEITHEDMGLHGSTRKVSKTT
jgi:Holliday junction resolvasome RuvABC endonuclease subunit